MTDENKVLIAGFKGKTNSANILLDLVGDNPTVDKLYLVNSFSTCQKQIEEQLKQKIYRYVIIFGQKPSSNNILIERCGVYGGKKFFSNFDSTTLERYIKDAGFSVDVSFDAGSYLCNYVYYCGLNYMEQNQMVMEIIFLHIPKLNRLFDISKFSSMITQYINELSF